MTPLSHDEIEDSDEPCCVCGKPSTHYYGGREDCPVCDSLRCGFTVQQGLDYHDEAGDRT